MVTMDIRAIVDYWKEMQNKTSDGHWVHPRDKEALSGRRHSFNLDFPVGPYIGDIVNAPVIVLGANAGYHPEGTPREFSMEEDIEKQIRQNIFPDKVDWANGGGSARSRYYKQVNYGKLLFTRQAVMIDACAYRSIDRGKATIFDDIPSVEFTRRWLREAVLPLVIEGKRLIIAKRMKLWKADIELKELEGDGVVCDPPSIKHLKRETMEVIDRWLRDKGIK